MWCVFDPSWKTRSDFRLKLRWFFFHFFLFINPEQLRVFFSNLSHCSTRPGSADCWYHICHQFLVSFPYFYHINHLSHIASLSFSAWMRNKKKFKWPLESLHIKKLTSILSSLLYVFFENGSMHFPSWRWFHILCWLYYEICCQFLLFTARWLSTMLEIKNLEKYGQRKLQLFNSVRVVKNHDRIDIYILGRRTLKCAMQNISSIPRRRSHENLSNRNFHPTARSSSTVSFISSNFSSVQHHVESMQSTKKVVRVGPHHH